MSFIRNYINRLSPSQALRLVHSYEDYERTGVIEGFLSDTITDFAKAVGMIHVDHMVWAEKLGLEVYRRFARWEISKSEIIQSICMTDFRGWTYGDPFYVLSVEGEGEVLN